jgi:glycosyltransferase involved in cell wall biosynthesis
MTGTSLESECERVSVVVTSFNHGRFLRDALSSAILQGDCVKEITLVDDGSDDDTPAIARDYAGCVQLIRTAHHGPGAAKNTGWRAGSAPLVAFLDGDDTWTPKKLSIELAALDRQPQAGLVYSDTARVRGDGSPIDRWSSHFPPVSGDVFLPMLRYNRVQTSTVVIRREVLEDLGGFDDSLDAWEDVDLWVRTARRYAFAYVPDVLGTYRMHGGLSSRAMAMARGRLTSVEKVLADTASPQVGDRLRRAVLADAYAEVGVAYYLESDMPSARSWLSRSWQIDTHSLLRNRSIETYLKSLAGICVVRSLRKRFRPATRATGRS